MNDARLIEDLHIRDIRIAEASNDTANSNWITVRFISSPYKYDDLDRKRVPGKLIEDMGRRWQDMEHKFCIKNMGEVWPEIIKRAKAYKELSLSFVME